MVGCDEREKNEQMDNRETGGYCGVMWCATRYVFYSNWIHIKKTLNEIKKAEFTCIEIKKINYFCSLYIRFI